MIDGLIVVLEPLIAWLASKWPAFGSLVNRIMIDRIVRTTRSRPHPWSTKADYICWSGLTDRTYSARHLPAQTGSDDPPLDIAKSLFSRSGAEQRQCPKSTALFPAFAQYLTDGFIRTMVLNDDDLTDRKRTTTNHEIDLCPLYGRNEKQTLALRLRSEAFGQRGRLKCQLIGGEEYPPYLHDAAGTPCPEFNDLDVPLGIDKVPEEARRALFAVGGDRANATVAVSMINTLFLREHNRLAGQIERANPDWDDTRVFEVARNVVIVVFIKIVVEEYINHISPSRVRFLADPAVAWRARWNKPNWITAEFSLLYRWHSLVPDKIQWGEDLRPTAALQFANDLLTEIGLAEAFVRMSAQPAAELGMGNTAEFLQSVEEKAIQQARDNKLARYSIYRTAFGIKPAKDWTDVSSSRDTIARLKAAYPLGVGSLEFYTGIFAEDRVSNSPLPPLILRMVAIDAFSQALTNPLLSEPIWGDRVTRLSAFTKEGLAAIEATGSLRDVLVRNGADPGDRHVGMTRLSWRRAPGLQRAA
ncbi:peroxidase family protein [Sinorhizobium terangae]|uniref:peroxidase family protein n=1 Tax=Sinorhizobium terangae TaxID=110322 RepID=UPI0024B19F76|nr:peroxidase family protein [Sinorhizobium terangae]WFU49145.1 peroxidase family protein [Sinorhizobium terangae]